MSIRVTLEITEAMYRRAEYIAQATGRAVETVLAEALEHSMQPLGTPTEALRPVETLTDDEIMALVDLRLPPEKSSRLSQLLDRQQAGKLAEGELSELWALMQVYQDAALRKADAAVEMTRRGLGRR